MISKAALDLLTWMDREGCDGATDYDGELIHEGRTWTAGTKRIPGRVAEELLFWCCIKLDSFSGEKLERFRINGTGRDMVVNPEQTMQQVNALLRTEQP